MICSLAIFSNLDRNGNVLITEDVDNINNSCHENTRINQIINSLAVYLYTNKYQFNCRKYNFNLDEIDNDDIIFECNKVINKIISDDIDILNYNKNVSRCPDLILNKKDHFKL